MEPGDLGIEMSSSGSLEREYDSSVQSFSLVLRCYLSRAIIDYWSLRGTRAICITRQSVMVVVGGGGPSKNKSQKRNKR